MKTKKMRLTGIVLLAVSLIAIGVLAIPKPKEAQAATNHSIHLTLNGGGDASGVHVEFWIQTGPDPDDPDDWTSEPTITNMLGKAYYSATPNTLATHWIAKMTDEDYAPVNPIDRVNNVYYPTTVFAQVVDLQ